MKEQKKLFTEIMNDDAKDGLYKQDISKTETTQTAVEWLALRYHHRHGYLSLEDIAKAKAMEKEQIQQAWLMGENDGSLEPKMFVELSEQYYNDLYNK